jgi:hypothetical protein
MRAKWRAVAVDACIVVSLTIAIGYVANSAGRAAVDQDLLAHALGPQERDCVIRVDVCKLVEALRASGAAAFDPAPDLAPEVYQRIVELAFPMRVMRDAPLRVDFCRRGKPADQPRLRVADLWRSNDSDADLCIFDRR